MNGKAELTLEDLRTLEWRGSYFHCPACDAPRTMAGKHGMCCWLAAAIAEAERVETAAERVARAAQDGFVWDDDSPDEPCYAEEILSNYCGDIAEVQLGLRLPNAFGLNDDKGDHWFNTREEAESALAAVMKGWDADAEETK